MEYTFKRRDLLVLSLTHPSWVSESPDPEGVNSNQRLEFLGDAVLNIVISEWLYNQFPGEQEGFLTRNRAALVKGKILVEIAEELELEPYLKLGKSETNAGGRGRRSRLEDALEAVMGAVYVDGGLEAARSVIARIFGDLTTRLDANLLDHNAKGRLQEKIQEWGGTTHDIEYHLLDTTGPDHDRKFTVELRYKGERLGEGAAKSRKAAESLAAKAGLQFLSENGRGREV